MSNLTRWNPINEFEDLMSRYNRMFGLPRTEVKARTCSAAAIGHQLLISKKHRKPSPSKPNYPVWTRKT